jgi:hypothetical protein
MDDLKKTVIKLLEDDHIKRGTRRYEAYEAAKALIEPLDLEPIQWHDACIIVAEYLGI